MYNQVVTQTLYSTKISFSLFCNLSHSIFPGHKCHFVAANDNILSLYSIIWETSTSHHKALHLKSFKLEGIITGISAISSAAFSSALEVDDIGLLEQSFDYLIISFFPQKVSIVSFSENDDLLRTVSLVSFDETHVERDLLVK